MSVQTSETKSAAAGDGRIGEAFDVLSHLAFTGAVRRARVDT